MGYNIDEEDYSDVEDVIFSKRLDPIIFWMIIILFGILLQITWKRVIISSVVLIVLLRIFVF